MSDPNNMTDEQITAEIGLMVNKSADNIRTAMRIRGSLQRRKRPTPPSPLPGTTPARSGATGTLTAAGPPPPIPPPTPSAVPQIGFVGPCDAGRIQVFGMAFHAGYIPAGQPVALFDAQDAEIQTQTDIISTHADGSLRFASLAVRLPALTTGQRLNCRFDPMSSPPAPDILLNFAGHTAAMDVFGQPLPNMMNLLGTRRLSGPLVVEDEVTLPLPMGAIQSSRLIFDRRVTADGRVSIDLEPSNDSMDWPDATAATLPDYRLRLTVDGILEIDRTITTHGCYTAFSRLYGDAGDACTVIHDLDYLADHGFLPRFDRQQPPPESRLADFATMVTAPDWNTPWAARGQMYYMPNTGGRWDIGIVTEPQAVWIVTGDPRAKRVAEDQARALSGAPWRSHDRAAGAWLSPARRPNLWADGRDSVWVPPGGESPWTPDTAHQPCGYYVPALLTARRAFLRGLEAQAAFCIMTQTTGCNIAATRSVHRWNQVRATAWMQRTIQRAATLLGAPWTAATQANYADLLSLATTLATRQGEPHGWTSGTNGDTAPWQEDFVSLVVEEGAALGYADALAVLTTYRDNWTIKRFTAKSGWDPILGLAYYLEIGPTPNANWVCYQTWAELAANGLNAWRAADMKLPGKLDMEYTMVAAATLARMQDRLGAANPALIEARAFVEPLIPAGMLQGYMRMSIVPRGETRG